MRSVSPRPPQTRPRSTARPVSLVNVARSEWVKLRTLPSTVWSLLTAVALIVATGVLVCMARTANWPPRDASSISSFDATAVSLTGVHLAQFATGVLGVLLVTGEYATGMIRTTLAAVPRRLPVLWAKTVVFALTTFALCLPATLAAFIAGQAVLSSKGIDTSLDQPGVARAVIGGALYLAAVGILGLALGALLRNTAAAVSALVGLLFLLPILAGLLPDNLSEKVNAYLPMSAGDNIMNVSGDQTALGPWTGLGVFCLYALVALGAAAWLLRRRDA